MRRRPYFAMLLAAALALTITTATAMPTMTTAETYPGELPTATVTSSYNVFTFEAEQVQTEGSHFGGFHYGATEDTEAVQGSKTTVDGSDVTGETQADEFHYGGFHYGANENTEAAQDSKQTGQTQMDEFHYGGFHYGASESAEAVQDSKPTVDDSDATGITQTDKSHYGGFHYGATEGTEAAQDSTPTDDGNDAIGTESSTRELEGPVPSAIDSEQTDSTLLLHDTVYYGNGEDSIADLPAFEGNKAKVPDTELPAPRDIWKMFDIDYDSTEPAAKEQENTKVVQLHQQTDMFRAPSPYINNFSSISQPLLEARADDTDDLGLSSVVATEKPMSGSSDSPLSPNADPKTHENIDTSQGQTDPSVLPAATEAQEGAAATYKDNVYEGAASPTTSSTTYQAISVPEQSGTGSDGMFDEGSGVTTVADFTLTPNSRVNLSTGEEDMTTASLKSDATDIESPEKPDSNRRQDGQHTGSASVDKHNVPAVIVTARDDKGGDGNKDRANPSPQAGQSGLVPPALRDSGAMGAQGEPSGSAQIDHLMARAGDKPGSDKASEPESPRAEQPKASGGESGRTDPPKNPAKAPRSADVPTGGSSKAGQPESPRSEQPKGSGGESGRADPPKNPAEAPRSADVPTGGSSKAGQPESPRAEQPKGSGGESGRADPAKNPAEAPRSADVPTGGSSKAGQPESPRAEQPKGSGGESGRADPPKNPAEAPRSADVPTGGSSKAGQPESPRAEQPKGSGGESGGADPPKNPAEAPRSADVPTGGSSKAGQPESPRAEQPKGSGGESGRADPPKNPAEAPRSADVPTGGSSKAGQPESPRAEQPKASGGESGRGADPPNKPAEAPRNTDGPASANKPSQPESPRTQETKTQAPGETRSSLEGPRSEQQNPPAAAIPMINENNEGWTDSQPEIPRTGAPKAPASSGASDEGRGEKIPDKAQETVVIVEDKKEGKEQTKKPKPTKMVENTESETHISIDGNPQKNPTDVVVEKSHGGKKDNGEDTVLVVKNVTVEVVPEADTPDSKPTKPVPGVPPKETAVYPPAEVVNPPYTPYQQPPPYQPYQPYQPSPYQQPAGTIVYLPQPVYQPAPQASYVPGPPPQYQPGQHMGTPYQPAQYPQPYASYQPTSYNPVYQPTYIPVNGPAYPQAPHTVYNAAYAPSYRPTHRVVYVPRYQPPRAKPAGYYIPIQANHRVFYAPPYTYQQYPAPMSLYQQRHPPAANIRYAVPAHSMHRQYSQPKMPAYPAQPLRMVKATYKRPVLKRPSHQDVSHGGHRRHVDDQADSSQLHFPPVIPHMQNAAVPSHALPLKEASAVHPMPLSPSLNHKVPKQGGKPILKAGHALTKMIGKKPSYSESYIPVVYWRSAALDEEGPAGEVTEKLETTEGGDARLQYPLYTEPEAA